MISCTICTHEFTPPIEKGLLRDRYIVCPECIACDRQKILDNFATIKEILENIKE